MVVLEFPTSIWEVDPIYRNLLPPALNKVNRKSRIQCYRDRCIADCIDKTGKPDTYFIISPKSCHTCNMVCIRIDLKRREIPEFQTSLLEENIRNSF